MMCVWRRELLRPCSYSSVCPPGVVSVTCSLDRSGQSAVVGAVTDPAQAKLCGVVPIVIIKEGARVAETRILRVLFYANPQISTRTMFCLLPLCQHHCALQRKMYHYTR